MKRLIIANIFNILDIITTLIAVSIDIAIEGNSLMALALQNPYIFVLAKVIVFGLLSVYVGYSEKNIYTEIAKWFMMIAMGFIVIWNSMVIFIL